MRASVGAHAMSGLFSGSLVPRMNSCVDRFLALIEVPSGRGSGAQGHVQPKSGAVGRFASDILSTPVSELA
eukprot:5307969-Pyramimonas_sp.AAC.1